MFTYLSPYSTSPLGRLIVTSNVIRPSFLHRQDFLLPQACPHQRLSRLKPKDYSLSLTPSPILPICSIGKSFCYLLQNICRVCPLLFILTATLIQTRISPRLFEQPPNWPSFLLSVSSPFSPTSSLDSCQTNLLELEIIKCHPHTHLKPFSYFLSYLE